MPAAAPGVYTVSEAPVAGTNPADYRSTVECKRGTRRKQVGPEAYESLQLSSGERAVGTFRNVRRGSPAIAIDRPARPRRRPATRSATPSTSQSRATFPSRRTPSASPIPTATTPRSSPRRQTVRVETTHRERSTRGTPGPTSDAQDRRPGKLHGERCPKYRECHGRGGWSVQDRHGDDRDRTPLPSEAARTADARPRPWPRPHAARASAASAWTRPSSRRGQNRRMQAMPPTPASSCVRPQRGAFAPARVCPV